MPAALRAVVTGSADEFDARAGELLASRVEHNVLATTLGFARAGRPREAPPVFAYVEDGGGKVVAAAVRGPPRRMLASVMDAAAADVLMAAWLEAEPDVPGVGAPLEVARRLAHRWEELTGGHVALAFAEALHALDRVTEPARPAQGRLRTAGPGDRELLVEWMRDFSVEAGLDDAFEAPDIVDRRLSGGLLHVWDDEGPVAVVGDNRPVAGVVRIGPVYTPPAWRSRGYASSAVAAVSRLALARGARQCALFTDLANPTSNRIYAALGYRRVADWEELAFIREPIEAPSS